MDAEEFMEQMDSLWFVHNILMPLPSVDVATIPRSSSEEDPKILHHQTEPLPSVDESNPPELPEPEPKPKPQLKHIEAMAASRLKQRKKIRRGRREGTVGSERAAELEFQELKGFFWTWASALAEVWWIKGWYPSFLAYKGRGWLRALLGSTGLIYQMLG